jgi:hypothetical protein
MGELWLDYGNAPFGGLALVGLVLAFAGGTRAARRLAWLGVALVVPGVVNYGAMMVHALDHVFWSMQGFAGLCVLGAIVPLTGLSWFGRRSPAVRVAGVALIAGALATGAFGAWHTHTVITRYEWADNGTPALMAKALPALGGCTWTLTSAERCPQQFFGATQTWPEIDSAEKLQVALQAGRNGGLRGRVGFVLHPRHRDSPLKEALDRLAERVDVDGVLVYRLTL